jgi:hypothetical protein
MGIKLNMKKIFFIILANFFVLVIVFFCLEFFIRIRGTFYFFNTRDVKELYIKSKNTKIAYKMHPNFKGYAYGNYVELNNEGFRFSKKRPYFDSKKKKIFGFGDSVGFGWGIPGENTFYSVLNKKFIDAKSEYEVLNYSVVGYNFEQYIFLLKELLEENKIPEIILITIVNNDFLEKQWVDEEGYLRADKNYNKLFVYKIQNYI